MDNFNLLDYQALHKEQKRRYLDYLYQYLLKNNYTAEDYQKLKIKSTAPICHRCESENVIKEGVSDVKLVYKCKDCGRLYREPARTFLYRIRKAD